MRLPCFRVEDQRRRDSGIVIIGTKTPSMHDLRAALTLSMQLVLDASEFVRQLKLQLLRARRIAEDQTSAFGPLHLPASSPFRGAGQNGGSASGAFPAGAGQSRMAVRLLQPPWQCGAGRPEWLLVLKPAPSVDDRSGPLWRLKLWARSSLLASAPMQLGQQIRRPQHRKIASSTAVAPGCGEVPQPYSRSCRQSKSLCTPAKKPSLPEVPPNHRRHSTALNVNAPHLAWRPSAPFIVPAAPDQDKLL